MMTKREVLTLAIRAAYDEYHRAWSMYEKSRSKADYIRWKRVLNELDELKWLHKAVGDEEML